MCVSVSMHVCMGAWVYVHACVCTHSHGGVGMRYENLAVGTGRVGGGPCRPRSYGCRQRKTPAGMSERRRRDFSLAGAS